jgi:hypothetical protein
MLITPHLEQAFDILREAIRQHRPEGEPKRKALSQLPKKTPARATLYVVKKERSA